MNLGIFPINENDKKPQPLNESQLGFGQYFTNHLFSMRYDPVKGWHEAKIEPYHAFKMDPATLAFHYGQEIFEGMKAFSVENGGINLFRPQDHFARLNQSARRLCMPEIDEGFVLDALKKLVLQDREWIPKSIGASLYIRPVMIATEASLGVKASSKYLFYIIIGPVGAYYPEGFNPVKICVCNTYVRSARGGTGEIKTGGNYAASLLAAQEAKSKGYTQVLWLDAVERKYVEEVGTMNIFFAFDHKVVTPALTGSILPGITRDSVIKILRDFGSTVEERPIEIGEIIDGLKDGSLREVFGTGTAAVISPVGELNYQGKDYSINNNRTGALASRLFAEITGIQYGKKNDPYNWVEKVG